ncbi:conserved Plasmodium protein, unknown function [Plasmodium gallinaceum]|uniref:Uncharacterized protein n=1 Tax=Plasmodium gallinaceum TaxID=5849 RepID=A0A1J1H0B5_PLAGA|nr:conserved Plasmodium protein, unknown function [Plasmodium gallinaceum]CRG98140.1 conserved Plasmodium protein, unknown function [Plasmodium gallinaceum]
MNIIEAKNKKVSNKQKQYVESVSNLCFYSTQSLKYSETRKRNASLWDYNNDKINVKSSFLNHSGSIIKRKKEKFYKNSGTYELGRTHTNDDCDNKWKKNNFNKIYFEKDNMKIFKTYNIDNSIREKYKKNEFSYSDNILSKANFEQNYEKSICKVLNKYSKKFKTKSFDIKINSNIFEKYDNKDFKLKENVNNTKSIPGKQVLNFTRKTFNVYRPYIPLKEENMYVIKNKNYNINEINTKQKSAYYLNETKDISSYSNITKFKSENLSSKNKENNYILLPFKLPPNKKKENFIHQNKKLKNDVNYEIRMDKNKKENFLINKKKEIQNKKFTYLKKQFNIDQNSQLILSKSQCNIMKINNKIKEKGVDIKNLKYSLYLSKDNINDRKASNSKLIKSKNEKIIYFFNYNKDTLKYKIKKDLKEYTSNLNNEDQFNKSILNSTGKHTFSGINIELNKINEGIKEYANEDDNKKTKTKKTDLKKKNESILGCNSNKSLKGILYSDNEKVYTDNDVTNKFCDTIKKNNYKEKVDKFLEEHSKNNIYTYKGHNDEILKKNKNEYENIYKKKTNYENANKISQIKYVNNCLPHNNIHNETEKSGTNISKVKLEVDYSEKRKFNSHIENLRKEKLEIEKNKKEESKSCDLNKKNLKRKLKLQKKKSNTEELEVTKIDEKNESIGLSDLPEKHISLENFEKNKLKRDTLEKKLQKKRKLKIKNSETDVLRNSISKEKFEKDNAKIEKRVNKSEINPSNENFEKDKYKKKKKEKKSKKEEFERNEYESGESSVENKPRIEKLTKIKPEEKYFKNENKIIELKKSAKKIKISEIKKDEKEISETSESWGNKSGNIKLKEKLEKKKLVTKKLEKNKSKLEKLKKSLLELENLKKSLSKLKNLKKSLSELEKFKIRRYKEKTLETKKSKEKNRPKIDEIMRYNTEESQKDESGNNNSKEKLEEKKSKIEKLKIIKCETEISETGKSETSKSDNNNSKESLGREMLIIKNLENDMLKIEKLKMKIYNKENLKRIKSFRRKLNEKKFEENKLKMDKYLEETFEIEKLRKNILKLEKLEESILKLEKEDIESKFEKLKMKKCQKLGSKVDESVEEKLEKKLEEIKLKLRKLKMKEHEDEAEINEKKSSQKNELRKKKSEKLEVKKYITETSETERSITETGVTDKSETDILKNNKLKLRKLKKCKIILGKLKKKKYKGDISEINESEKKQLKDEKTKKNTPLMDKLEKNRLKLKKLENYRIKAKKSKKSKQESSKLKVKKYMEEQYEKEELENIFLEKKMKDNKPIINQLNPEKLEIQISEIKYSESEMSKTKEIEKVENNRSKLETFCLETEMPENYQSEKEIENIYKLKKKKIKLDKSKKKIHKSKLETIKSKKEELNFDRSRKNNSDIKLSIRKSKENLETDRSKKKMYIEYKLKDNEFELEKLGNDEMKEEKSEDEKLGENIYIESYEREMYKEEKSHRNKSIFDKLKIEKNGKKKSEESILKKNKTHIGNISETEKLKEKLKSTNKKIKERKSTPEKLKAIKIKKKKEKSKRKSIEKVIENENSKNNNAKNEQINILKDTFNNIGVHEYKCSNLSNLKEVSEKSSKEDTISKNLKTINYDEQNIHDSTKINNFQIKDYNENKREIKKKIIKIFKSSLEDFYFNKNTYSPGTLTLNNIHKENGGNFHRNLDNNESNHNFYNMNACKEDNYKKKKTYTNSISRSKISLGNDDFENIRKENIEVNNMGNMDYYKNRYIDVSRYINENDFKSKDRYKSENFKLGKLYDIYNSNKGNYLNYYNEINKYNSNKEYYYNENEGDYENIYKKDSLIGTENIKKQDIRYNNEIYLHKYENLTKSNEKIHLDILYKSQPSEIKLPNNLSLFIKKKIDVELKKNMYKKIYQIVNKNNYDNKEEIKRLLRLFFKYMKLNKFISKSDFLLKNDTEKVKKTIQKKRKKRKKIKENNENRQEDVNNNSNNTKKRKMKIINVDNATNNLPLTMLIIRNFEEKKNFDKNIKIRYKVELVSLKKPFKIKEIIEKEKYLFSRVEKIYDFSNLDKNKTNDNYNLINKYIPFPNMKNYLSEYQHKFTICKSKSGKKINFFNMNNIFKTNEKKKKYNVKFDGMKENIKRDNDNYSFETKSKLNMFTYASFKEKESKNFLIKRVSIKKKENETLNKNDILKYSHKKMLLLKSFSSQNKNKTANSNILSPKKKNYVFKSFAMNNINTSFNRNEYIINFNKYTEKIKECITTDKNSEKMNQTYKNSLGHVDSFLKVMDNIKNKKFILESHKSGMEKIDIQKSKNINLYETNISKYNSLKISLKDLKKIGVKKKEESKNTSHYNMKTQGLSSNENLYKVELSNNNYNEYIKIKENKKIQQDKTILENNDHTINNNEHNNIYKNEKKKGSDKYDKNENIYKFIDKKSNYVKNKNENDSKIFDKNGSHKKNKDENSYKKIDKKDSYNKYEDIYKNIDEISNYNKYENIYKNINNKNGYDKCENIYNNINNKRSYDIYENIYNNINNKKNYDKYENIYKNIDEGSDDKYDNIYKNIINKSNYKREKFKIIHNKNSHKVDKHNFDNYDNIKKEDTYISNQSIGNEKEKYTNKIEADKEKFSVEILNEKKKIDKNINLQFRHSKVIIKKNSYKNHHINEKFSYSQIRRSSEILKESIKKNKKENNYNISKTEKYIGKLNKNNAVSEVKNFENIMKIEGEKKKYYDFDKNRNKNKKFNFDFKIKGNTVETKENEININKNSLKLNMRKRKENETNDFSKIIKKKNFSKLNRTNNLSKIIKKNNFSKLNRTNNLSKIIKKNNISKLNRTNNLSKITKMNNISKLNRTNNFSKIIKKGNSSKTIKKSNFLKLNKTNVSIKNINKKEKLATIQNVERNISIYDDKDGTFKKNTSRKVKKLVKSSKKVSPNFNYPFSFESEIEIDENFIKNNKKEGLNSSYIDLKKLNFSKSSLENFIEKNLFEKSNSEIKFGYTKKKDFQIISNTDNSLSIKKKKKRKKKLFEKNINSKKTSRKDQSSNISYDKNKKQLYFSSKNLIKKKGSTTYQKKKKNSKFSIPKEKGQLKIFDLNKNLRHFGDSFIYKKKNFNKSLHDEKRNSFDESLKKFFHIKRKVKLSKNITINFSNDLANLETMESKNEESEVTSNKEEQMIFKEKNNKSDNALVIKINIITIFLLDLHIKKANMNSNYYMKVTIYFSNDIKTIKNNCVTETFQSYFTSYTNGVGLCSDAFKKINCGSSSKNLFKIVISCRKEKAILKKELIKLYSRTFEAPVDLRTYSLCRDKKYSYETNSVNDEHYENNGTIIFGTL